MMDRHTFLDLEGSQQLDLLGQQGTLLTEGSRTRGRYELFYALGDFFVRLCLRTFPGRHILLTAFTRKDPVFNELVDSIPVVLEPFDGSRTDRPTI